MTETSDEIRIQCERNQFAAFGGGALIGYLGGLIGLGITALRLPLLISAFGFPALEAVILDKGRELGRCSVGVTVSRRCC